MGKISNKYVKAAVIPGVALSLTIIVSTLSSCSFDVEFRLGFPGDRDVKPEKRSTKESVEDKPVPKLSMLYVYGDTVLKGITLGEMIGDGLLIAEIDKSDDPEVVKSVISLLAERAAEGRLDVRTIVVAGGYNPGDATTIKRDMEVPFAVYTTEENLRTNSVTGPRLIYKSESLKTYTKFIFRGLSGGIISDFLDEVTVMHKKSL